MADQPPQDREREAFPQPYDRSASHVHPEYRDGWNAALAAALASTARQEPVAWLTEDGDRVVTAKAMKGARKDGGAILSGMRPYSVAAYDHPAPDAAAIRAQALEEACQAVYGLCDSDNVAERTVKAIRALAAKGTT